MIELRIPGEPLAQGRPRMAVVAGRARVYDPPKSRKWKAAAKREIKLQLLPVGDLPRPVFPDGPVWLMIVAVFARPASVPKREGPGRQAHAKRGDADNVAKAFMDAAEGELYTRDAQVSRLLVEKYVAAEGEVPGLAVAVGRPGESRAFRAWLVRQHGTRLERPERVG